MRQPTPVATDLHQLNALERVSSVCLSTVAHVQSEEAGERQARAKPLVHVVIFNRGVSDTSWWSSGILPFAPTLARRSMYPRSRRSPDDPVIDCFSELRHLTAVPFLRHHTNRATVGHCLAPSLYFATQSLYTALPPSIFHFSAPSAIHAW